MLRCECCGSSDDIVLGQNTLFSEYVTICGKCLEKLSAYENEPTAIEKAWNKLDTLEINEDDILGFYVEGDTVMIDYLKNGLITKMIIVECDSNDEAIEVLCEIV